MDDQRNYEVLPLDPTGEIKILINSMVEQATVNRWITEKEAMLLLTINQGYHTFTSSPRSIKATQPSLVDPLCRA